MKKQLLVLAMSLVPLALMAAPPQNADETAQATESRKNTQHADQRHCIRHTGSRIHDMRAQRQRRSGQKADKKECVMVAGRVYSREDIERTGAFDLLDALRRLDPAIQ